MKDVIGAFVVSMCTVGCAAQHAVMRQYECLDRNAMASDRDVLSWQVLGGFVSATEWIESEHRVTIDSDRNFSRSAGA